MYNRVNRLLKHDILPIKKIGADNMKKISGVVYIHKSATNQLTSELLSLVNQAEKMLVKNYDIIKVDSKNKKVSFIQSPDWDTAREPLVGDAYNVDITTEKIKIIKSKGQIYHHKWMFVNEDYQGFDVEESKRWSDTWTKVIPKELKTKIGYKKNWDKILKEYGL